MKVGDIVQVMKLAYFAANPKVPSMAGKVVIVTGSNTGIGKETARHLVGAGARVIMACRNKVAAQQAIDELSNYYKNGGSAEFLPLDLSSLASVADFVKKFESLGVPLDVLINNAGTNSMFGCNQDHTTDGLNWVMAVNYLGHFHLTNLLVPKLKASGHGRIVNVSSFMHHFVFSAPEDPMASFVQNNPKTTYQLSKLYQVLHSNELNRRYSKDGITANSVHPGAANTDIWRTIPWFLQFFTKILFWFVFATSEVGSRSSVFAASAPELEGKGGQMIYDCAPEQASPLAQDKDFATTIWTISEEVIQGVHSKGKK